VRALFGVEARLADEADAIALAVCHLAGRAARPPPGRPAVRRRPPSAA
jgi:Holliday junction resolvasome RuvABC endonuclease subunit